MLWNPLHTQLVKKKQNHLHIYIVRWQSLDRFTVHTSSTYIRNSSGPITDPCQNVSFVLILNSLIMIIVYESGNRYCILFQKFNCFQNCFVFTLLTCLSKCIPLLFLINATSWVSHSLQLCVNYVLPCWLTSLPHSPVQPVSLMHSRGQVLH